MTEPDHQASIWTTVVESRTLLSVAGMIWFPFVFLGYGSDNDTYGVLDAGRLLATTGVYTPSRNPGYFLFETVVYVLDQVGGSFATNLCSLIFSLGAAACFLHLCRIWKVKHRKVLLFGFVLHPWFLMNAAATMDYNWALASLLFCLCALFSESFFFAGLAAGAAIGLRSSSCIGIGIFYLYAFISMGQENRKKIFFGGVLGAVLAGCCYLPSAQAAGWTLDFLKPGIGGPELWTLKMRLGRYLYKNLYFLGVPATVLLCALILPLSLKRIFGSFKKNPRAEFIPVCVLTIIAYQCLYLKFPLEIPYLLPTLPFLLLLIGITLEGSRQKLLAGFILLVISSGFVKINLAKPDKAGQAANAMYGIWIEKGPLLEDWQLRHRLRFCKDSECWNKHMHP